MKMISAGAGLGMGVKDYRVIFAFENQEALTKFLNSGWECWSGSRRCRQGERIGRGVFRSRQRGAWSLGVRDYQEWSGSPVDTAGHEVLKGRRPQQEIVSHWIADYRETGRVNGSSRPHQ